MNTNKYIRRIVKNLRKTYMNKLCALTLLGLSMIPIYLDNDSTFLVFAACFAVPMFFTKKQWIY